MGDVEKKPRIVSAVENQDSEVDFISNLHENLIEAILVKLPLRDAARTCILSRRWKNVWCKLPQLNIDSTVWQGSLQKYHGLCDSKKIDLIIDPILKLHQGPIVDFCIDIPEFGSYMDINPIVSCIAEKGVEYFFLRLGERRRLRLTSTIFTCPTLTDLWLYNCVINLPLSSFTGLNRLTRLVLGCEVEVSPKVLGSLVSSCPSLKTLSLQTSIDIRELDIVAPSIISLYCYYHHPYDCRRIRRDGNGQQARSSNKSNILSGFPNLQQLHTDRYYIKFLAVADSIQKDMLQTCMQHLRFIFLYSICLDDEDQYSCVLRLIRCSPNLKKICISLQADKATVADVRNRQLQDYYPLTLSSLEEVEIRECVGRMSEMMLIRIFLENSPMLKKMMIQFCTSTSTEMRLQISKQLDVYERVSPEALVPWFRTTRGKVHVRIVLPSAYAAPSGTVGGTECSQVPECGCVEQQNLLHSALGAVAARGQQIASATPLEWRHGVAQGLIEI